MPATLTFTGPATTDGSSDVCYSIVTAGKMVGEIRLVSDHERPVWIWRIVIADKVIANGAAFTLIAAKSGSKFAWQGHGAVHGVPDHAPERVRDETGDDI